MGRVIPKTPGFTKLLLGLRASEQEALNLRVAAMETKQPGSSMVNIKFGLDGNVTTHTDKPVSF